jgi:glycosyltransferase involved in cell wall biosynthesis
VRLLSVINNPLFGGGHTQMVRLAAPLATRGIETLGVTPAGAPAAQRVRDGGVEVVEVPLHRLRATPDPRVQLPFLAATGPEVARLRRLIRERGIDVVQVHADINFHGAVAGRLAGAAVVWQLYDTRTPIPLRRVTMPFVTRIADVITTWGEELGRAHPGTEGLDGRWLTVFPPVADAEFGPPDAAARDAARRELAVPDGAQVIGAIGNRNPSKGFEYLARALAEVRRAHPDAVVRVLGAPSPPHAAWERSVLDEARSLGLDEAAFAMRDGGTRVPELIAAFDVLALSSVPRSEGMPTVILEAMATGLPVAAADVGAVRELVAEGETGFVVAPEDPPALAAAIGRLLDDPQLRARLGEGGRRRFAEVFSLERLADRHAEAYRLALEHRDQRAATSR